MVQVHIVNLTIWLRLSVADAHTAGKHEFTKQCHVSEIIMKYIFIWFGSVTINKRYIQNNIPVDHPRASTEVKQKPWLTQQIRGNVVFRLWRIDAQENERDAGMSVVKTSHYHAKGWDGRDGDRETDTEIYVLYNTGQLVCLIHSWYCHTLYHYLTLVSVFHVSQNLAKVFQITFYLLLKNDQVCTP